MKPPADGDAPWAPWATATGPTPDQLDDLLAEVSRRLAEPDQPRLLVLSPRVFRLHEALWCDQALDALIWWRRTPLGRLVSWWRWRRRTARDCQDAVQ